MSLVGSICSAMLATIFCILIKNGFESLKFNGTLDLIQDFKMSGALYNSYLLTLTGLVAPPKILG